MAKRAEAVAEERPRLSKDLVIQTAIQLADEGGFDALSMRRLAQALGVEAMSLYYYMKSKDELLADMADAVMAEVDPPAARKPSEWKIAVRASAMSYRDALRRHTWAHGLMNAPSRVRPAQLRYNESLLRTLRKGGFSPRMTHHAYHILDAHVIGSTLWEAGVMAAISKAKLEDVARKFLAQLPREQFPYFFEHAEQHMTKLTKGDRHPFEIGLDLILDGLERMRGVESAPARVPRRKRTPSPRRRAV